MTNLECAVEGYLVHDTLDEGGLAFAVLTHKGYLLATLDGEVDVMEHVVLAIGLAHLVADDGVVA